MHFTALIFLKSPGCFRRVPVDMPTASSFWQGRADSEDRLFRPRGHDLDRGMLSMVGMRARRASGCRSLPPSSVYHNARLPTRHDIWHVVLRLTLFLLPLQSGRCTATGLEIRHTLRSGRASKPADSGYGVVMRASVTDARRLHEGELQLVILAIHLDGVAADRQRPAFF